MTDEEAVRAAWVEIEHHTHGIYIFTTNWRVFDDFTEARAFTDQRRKQIAEVEEEIEWLSKEPERRVVARILVREQAALDELLRGWRQG